MLQVDWYRKLVSVNIEFPPVPANGSENERYVLGSHDTHGWAFIILNPMEDVGHRYYYAGLI